MMTKQPLASPDEIDLPAGYAAGEARTMRTQTHSPEACRRKAQECLDLARKLVDPKQKAAMLRYADWWTRLAGLGGSASVLLGGSDIASD